MSTALNCQAESLLDYYTISSENYPLQLDDSRPKSEVSAIKDLLSSKMAPTPWEIPRPLNQCGTTTLKFPVEACGEILGAAVSSIAAISKAPIGMVAFSVLAASAFAAQRQYLTAAIGGSLPAEPCSLFVLTIAESGDRKSAVDKIVTEPITSWEKDCLSEIGFPLLVSDSQDSNASGTLEYSQQQVVYSDVTYEYLSSRLIEDKNSSVGLFSDEGGSFLGGHSMTSTTKSAAISGLVKLWDNGLVERHRITNPEGNGKAYGRRLSMHLMGQPVVMKESLTDSLMLGQGFLARFLVTHPQSLAGTRLLDLADFSGMIPDAPELGRFHALLSKLLEKPLRLSRNGEILGEVVPLTSGAIEVFVENYNQIEIELGNLNDEEKVLKPFLSRLAQQARRVSTVLAVINQKEVVDAQMMAGAFEIVAHSKATWCELLMESRVQQDLRDAVLLRDYLFKQCSVKLARDIQRLGPSCVRKSKAKLMELLGLLEQYGWVKLDSQKGLVILNPLVKLPL